MGVVGWRRTWRVTIEWQSPAYSPTGQQEQIVEVDTPAQLRQLVMRLRADNRVAWYRYGRWRRWDATGMPRHCTHGHTLVHPHVYRIYDCQCGVGHAEITCWCRDRQLLPPLDAGCEPVPGDPPWT